MKKLICVLLTVLTVVAATAQERKKVAVVLSGGGAKGVAHIGALKVIERAGIHIDIITGTSMGSLVGGLYAIGYNSDLLDSLVRVQDWNSIFADKDNPSAQNLADRQKHNTYAIQRELSMGKRNPSVGGIIKGNNLSVLFHKLCAGYTDSLDFSHDLPIPYACVATNVVDNSEIDFHSGRLPQAMRASMAIPAVFTPVRIGDMVLVDGGLRNNYPVDIARQMGADIVIGVSVQADFKTASELNSTMSILGQVIAFNCQNKYEENLSLTDVPILVNTEGYNAASFNAAAIDTLIRRGEEETLKHWDELIALKERIGIDDSFKPVRLTPYRQKVMSEREPVTAFVFENISKEDEKYIREKYQLSRVDSIDTRLKERIASTMRNDLYYEDVNMHSVTDGDGLRVVFTAGKRKSSQLGVGFRFDTEEMVALQLNAEFPLRTSLHTDIDITARLGKRVMGRIDFTFHPTSFTSPVLNYVFRHNDINIYQDGDREYNILYNHHQAEFIPINFDVRNLNILMGARWDYIHFSENLRSTLTEHVQLTNKHYFSYRAQLSYNSENNWYFPTRGSRFKAGYSYLTDNFSKLDGSLGTSEVYSSWRKSFTAGNFTLQPLLYGRLLFGTTIPEFFGNYIGGDWFGHYVEQQMPFAGIGNVEYTDRHFVAAQLQAQQHFGSHSYILLRVAAAQHSHELKDLLRYSTMLGTQLAYYYNTMFGPIGVTAGYANTSKNPYFCINMGYEF